MKRANWTYLIATALVLSGGISGAGAGEKFFQGHGMNSNGSADVALGHSNYRYSHSTTTEAPDTTVAPLTTTPSRNSRKSFGNHRGGTATTTDPTTVATTAPTSPPTRQAPARGPAPATTPPTSPPTAPPTTPPTFAAPAAGCVGATMTQGQADINNAPAGTTFCLTGTHNWTLTPKAGDSLIGPATLDGGNSTNFAIVATAPNVTVTSLTIQHYNNGQGSQEGAIDIADDDGVKATASGWHLNGLDVGFNSSAGSGSGDGWVFTGGRFHDNGQEGIG